MATRHPQSDAEALWKRAQELGCGDYEKAETALRLGAEGIERGLRTGDLESIADAIQAKSPLEPAFDEGLELLMCLLREHGTVERAIADARILHEFEDRQSRDRLRTSRSTLRRQQILIDSYKDMLEGMAKAIAEATQAPDSGPIIRELDALRTSRWSRRIEAVQDNDEDLADGPKEGEPGQ